MWAANKYLKYSLSKSGAIVGLDHSTALRACKIIEEKEDKHLDQWQAGARKRFKEKLKPFLKCDQTDSTR